MLSDDQFNQLQRLSRKSRNKAVTEVIRNLFVNYEVSDHEAAIDDLIQDYDFKRYVKTGRDSLLLSQKNILALNEFHRSGETCKKKKLELVLALYQYQPRKETKNQLELIIVYQMPAIRVAELTKTSLQQLSRVVSQYKKTSQIINEVRKYF